MLDWTMQTWLEMRSFFADLEQDDNMELNAAVKFEFILALLLSPRPCIESRVMLGILNI